MTPHTPSSRQSTTDHRRPPRRTSPPLSTLDLTTGFLFLFASPHERLRSSYPFTGIERTPCPIPCMHRNTKTRSSMDLDLRRRPLLARVLGSHEQGFSPFILVQPGQGRSLLSPASRLMTTRLSRRSVSSRLDDTATPSSLAWLDRRTLSFTCWWALGGWETGFV